jgi:hypothetical protein
LTGEQVRMMTLDTLVAMPMIGRVNFIKLDVEMFELFLLHGAAETLSLSAPSTSIEISPYWKRRMSDYDYREIYRLPGEYGYDIYDEQVRRVEVGCFQDADEKH